MTYQGEPARATNAIMKVLVIVAIALVAYWASTGGLDEIVIEQAVTSTTSTTVSG